MIGLIAGLAITRTEADNTEPTTEVILEDKMSSTNESIAKEPVEEILICRWYDRREECKNLFFEGRDTGIELLINVNDNNIPENYYKYRNYIDFYVEYQWNGEEYVILKWYMVDIDSGEVLGHPTVDELENKYNIELHYDIETVEGIPEQIKLSDLKENVIYSFTPVGEVFDYPKMINDLGEDCVMWTMHYGNDSVYGKYAFPTEFIQDIEYTFSCTYFYEGDAWRVMYQKVNHDELMTAARDVFINLSELNTIEPNEKTISSNYIYNDLGKTVTLKISQKYPQENAQTFEITMEPEQLIGCTWMNHNIEILDKTE